MIKNTSKSTVEAQFSALPEKFRKGKVGQAFEHIIDRLEPNGRASLDIVLADFYPGIDTETARHRLQTQVINRAYEIADGIKPLELKMSRKPRSTQSEQQEQWLWFESTETINFAELAPHNDRYDEAEFVKSQAVQETGSQIRQAQELPLEATPPLQAVAAIAEPTQVPDAFTTAEQSLVLGDSTKPNLNLGRLLPQHGIESLGTRAQISDERFVGAEAAQTNGMPTEAEIRASDTVTCIEAMLLWACTRIETETPKPNRFAPLAQASESPHTKSLLALLGDYGTGKTSHAQQLTRILNGQSTNTEKPTNSPHAVMVDLALLAGAERLNELSLVELLVLSLKKQRTDGFRHEEAKELIRRVRQGEIVLIYDGFDELIKTTRDKLHGVLQQLLFVLQPEAKEGELSKAKVMLSCRTHYFRDAHEQLAFFDTRARGQTKRGDYLCLTLMPWTTENVKTYLSKHLDASDTSSLLNIIETTYNLQELASRPVLLAMMSEQLGELLRLHKAGEPISAAKLYGISVAEWVQRDAGKHVIQASHKPLVMGALASAMSNEGTESWTAENLDRWIVSVLPKLYPGVYELPRQAKEIQDDLRTATFIVRPARDQFNFAHKSFKEYFTARFVWDCLALVDQGVLEPEVARALMVSHPLNTESMGFMREWWAAQTAIQPEQAIRNASVLIGLLQDPHVRFVPYYLDEAGNVVDRSKVAESEKNGYYQAPDLHQTLFEIGLQLGLFEKEQIAKMTALSGRRFPVHASQGKHLNIRGLEFKRDRWRNLDFSNLPLDLRDANLLQLRTYRCDFGNTLCACANWAQTVMRDSTVKDLDWGEGKFAADRGGQMIRNGESKQPKKPLKGPWTKQSQTIYRIAHDLKFKLFKHGDFLVGNFGPHGLFKWDFFTGRLCAAVDEVDLPTASTTPISSAWASFNIDELTDQFFRQNLFSIYKPFAREKIYVLNSSQTLMIDVRRAKEVRCLHMYDLSGSATFDLSGNLHSFDEEAIDSWLFCLASGKPEPVEFGVPVDD
jgi:hypothetical protein